MSELKGSTAEILGVRAYARHRVVSHEAVRKAIATGRLARSVKKGKRGPLIDVEIADMEWEANTDPTQQRTKHRTKEPVVEQQSLYGTGGAAPPGPDMRPTLQRAQTARVTIQAQLAQIELQERRRDLVNRLEVEDRAFSIARMVRERMLVLSDRLAGELAPVAGDVLACRAVLDREIRAVLTDMAKAIAPQASKELGDP